jgi:F-type H+-transporting ATPase subunit b
VELNWTTVILEMVNFLVLVWILKHFLYRPVLQVIEERRARIQASLEQAQARQQQAEALRLQFENRLAEWQVEKQAAREALQREMETQRKQALQALETSLAEAREKGRVVEERRLREIEQHMAHEALELGGRFATRLLEGLAGPELEGRIFALLDEDLAGLPEPQRKTLRRAVQGNGDQVRVESAHPLNGQQHQALERSVRQLLGEDVGCSFHEQPELIAGLRLSLGDWSVEANLRAELRAFVDIARELD